MEEKNYKYILYSNRKHKNIDELDLEESLIEYKRKLYSTEITIKNQMKI